LSTKISIVFPTRGRYRKVVNALEKLFNNAHQVNNIEICFVFDDDDKDTYSKIITDKILNGKNFTYSVVDREKQNFGELYNIGYRSSTGDIIGIIADDVSVETSSWDTKVIGRAKEYKDEIYLVAPNDGKNIFATHFFVSRKVVEIMGFLQPPYFVADFGDMWFTEIFKLIGRFCYDESLLFIHKHPIHGLGENDQTYEDAWERKSSVPSLSSSEHPWNTYAQVRQEQISKLLKEMDP
jgi:glycosyltransferase involved in cell wall biosynthesis